MDTQGKKNAARVFAAAFAESFSTSLNEATGTPWPLELVDSPKPPTIKETPIHFRLTVAGAIHGECFVEIYEPQVAALVAKIAKPPASATQEDHGDTLATVISSAAVALAASLESEYGVLTVKVDRVAGLAFGGMFVVPLATPSDAPVLLYFDGQLLDALSSGKSGASQSSASKPGFDPHNLKLVMDVELNVSLRFGQCQLPLRDVLELGSGSVIELDRMVDEPVELFLDGKLIARGEAVIVDGNYGLRVTEIPQPVASHFLR
jgi:flagellar motor switch protein FliN